MLILGVEKKIKGLCGPKEQFKRVIQHNKIALQKDPKVWLNLCCDSKLDVDDTSLYIPEVLLSILYELLNNAVTTDGSHHKQWYLEQIAKNLKIPLRDHEDGIAC